MNGDLAVNVMAGGVLIVGSAMIGMKMALVKRDFESRRSSAGYHFGSQRGKGVILIATVQEAKQKWCPLFFIGAQMNPSFRGSPDNNMCSADDCMMWIWETTEAQKGKCGLCR
jgi:hypothetical protein